MDELGILRCYGRYANADIDIDTKSPKLLPCKHKFSKLVIMEIVHAGVSHTLSHLCHEFWIPKRQAEVRKVLSQCVLRRKHSAPPPLSTATHATMAS